MTETYYDGIAGIIKDNTKEGKYIDKDCFIRELMIFLKKDNFKFSYSRFISICYGSVK